MYRDPNLLKLAENQPCLLQASPKCLGDDGWTTVAAHSNQLIHSKGKGIKAEDCYSVWACYHCHTWLDQGNADWQAKADAWDVAFEQQIMEWVDMASQITVRPWKREAAIRALEYLGVID